MGDMANAELGITIVDNAGAKNRMDESGGLAKQQKWGLGYLNERIIGMLAALAISALMTVWVVTTPDVVRYGVTALIALFVVAIAVSVVRGKARLTAIRQQQISEHAT